MSEPKKRPGPLWHLFYGRQRRGFPWLLVVVLVAILALALSFAVPGGAFGFLILCALVAAIVAALRPRRRR